MELNRGAVGMSNMRIEVLRLNDHPMIYYVILYDEDSVHPIFMCGNRVIFVETVQDEDQGYSFLESS